MNNFWNEIHIKHSKQWILKGYAIQIPSWSTSVEIVNKVGSFFLSRIEGAIVCKILTEYYSTSNMMWGQHKDKSKINWRINFQKRSPSSRWNSGAYIQPTLEMNIVSFFFFSELYVYYKKTEIKNLFFAWNSLGKLTL